MMRILATLVCLLFSQMAFAGVTPKQKYSFYGTALASTTLDTASEGFTIDMQNPAVNGVWGLLLVWVTVTDANDSTTAINMTCTGSPDGGTTDYTLQSIAVAAGVGTSTNASWVKNPSAITSPKRWVWRVDIEGVPEVECTFTDTGGAAADTITADVSFAIKGS